MSSMGERILLHYLNELEESEMAEYMNFLQIYPLRRGCTKIPAEKLQGAEKDDIAYLMISYYKEDYALEIGRSILHQIHRRDLLDTYEESSLYCFREYRRQRQNRNEGMFSRIESYQKTVQEKEKEKEKPKFRLQELESGRKLSKVKIEDYNRLYTQRLKTRYRLMEDRNSRFGEYVYFRDRYAPLLMIKKHRDMKQREKELTWYGEKHVTMMDQRAASIYESLEEFFDPESDGVNACSLTDACYEMFAQVLRQSSFLKVLDLSHTPLSASGMKHLCCALRSHCCQLQSLMLNETTLTDASVEDLCSAVKANHSLRSLSLKSNLFSERAIASIEQLQQACKQLVHLEISKLEPTEGGTRSMFAAVASWFPRR